MGDENAFPYSLNSGNVPICGTDTNVNWAKAGSDLGILKQNPTASNSTNGTHTTAAVNVLSLSTPPVSVSSLPSRYFRLQRVKTREEDVPI
jgi:hypothetical protein